MKKTLIKSLIISGIINVVGCLTNFLCAKLGEFLLIKTTLSGGEYMGYLGFGILLEHIYPMGDGSGPGKITHLSFDIVNFLVYFVFVFLLVLATIFVIKKIKSIRNEEKEIEEDFDEDNPYNDYIKEEKKNNRKVKKNNKKGK